MINMALAKASTWLINSLLALLRQDSIKLTINIWLSVAKAILNKKVLLHCTDIFRTKNNAGFWLIKRGATMVQNVSTKEA